MLVKIVVFSQETNDSKQVSVKEKGDIEYTIHYNSRDSIRFDVDSQQVHLYGKAHVDYGTKIIKAGHIIIDWKRNVIVAKPIDSLGKLKELPVFIDNGETYHLEKITYNWKTGKGFMKGLVTSSTSLA